MDLNTDGNVGFDDFYDEVFAVKKASEVLSNFFSRPPSPRLLGDIWREGELAVMFGAAGVGKSVLATQIGRSIAYGEAVEPFEYDGKPRRVFYIDLKLTDDQWSMRYTDGHKGGRCGAAKFPANFRRVTASRDAQLPRGFKTFTQPLARAIAKLVRLHKPQVLIVDNVSLLRHSNDVTRDVIPLMRELSRLKKELGILILVLAQSEPRIMSPTLAIGDLRSASVICNYADSVFAVGYTTEDNVRYVKQLRSHSGEILYGKSHTAMFEIKKQIQDNFLEFDFQGFSPESIAMLNDCVHIQSPLADKAKALMDAGISYREIGITLGVSKTSAHRLVQQWKPVENRCPKDYRPPKPPPPPPPPQPVEPEPVEAEPVITPTAEQESEASDEQYFRKLGLLPKARPVPAADHKPRRERKEPPEEYRPPEIRRLEKQNGIRLAPRRNDYDKEIWVESFNPSGKPRIWYQFNNNGLRRWERVPNGINGSEVIWDP